MENVLVLRLATDSFVRASLQESLDLGSSATLGSFYLREGILAIGGECHYIPARSGNNSREEFRGTLQRGFMYKKLILALLLCAAPAMAQTIAIRAGNLIDPAKGTVSKDQIIVVKDGKIAAVGAGVAIPKDAQVVDLSKEWVMPGLMDAHTHVTFEEIPGKAPFEAMYLKQSTAYRALQGVHIGKVLLEAGIHDHAGRGKRGGLRLRGFAEGDSAGMGGRADAAMRGEDHRAVRRADQGYAGRGGRVLAARIH